MNNNKAISPAQIDIRAHHCSPGQSTSITSQPLTLTRPGDTVELLGRHTHTRPERMRVSLDVLHEQMEAVHIAAEVAESFQVTGILAGIAGVGTVVTGLYFGCEGIKDMGTAVKDKDIPGTLESVAHLALGGEALLEAAHLATNTSCISGMLGPAGCSFLNSPAFSTMGSVFGYIHGGSEVILGGKEIYDGKKQGDKKRIISGALNMGIGASMLGLASGGGIPCGVVLAALFLTKMTLTKREFFSLLPLSRIAEGLGRTRARR